VVAGRSHGRSRQGKIVRAPVLARQNLADGVTGPQQSRALASQLAISIGLVTAVWICAVGHWIAKRAVVPWDSKNQFYAFFRFLSATLRSGEWPFWNPYHYGGHPSVVDPQSLIFSPIFLVWGALDSLPTMRAFDLVVLAHLLVGGIALAAWGCRLRWPLPSCVLTATLFMFGGAASARLQHTGIILSYGMFPLALLLLQLALDRRSHAIAVGFAIVATCVVLGRSQVALLLCALLLFAVVAELTSSHQVAPYLRERSGVLATMAVTGGALLIVPMLLTLQFAYLSNRPAELLDEALRGSLYPANLATLAVPNIFGTHSSYWGPGAATLAEVDLTDDSGNYLFVGAVPTCLLLWFGVAGGRAWQPGRRLMTCTLAISCLFMLGRYTPLYGLAFQFLPGIDLFRRPTDASFLFGIALGILAGHCLSDYVREGLPQLRPLSTLAAVLASLAVVSSAMAFSARTGHGLDATRGAVIAGTIMLIAGALLFAMRHECSRAAAAALVTVAAVSELLWWNTASRLNAEPRNFYAVLEAPTGAEAAAITLLDKFLAADHERGEYPRIEVLGLGGPWQNLAMVRGWEATNGYNPLRIGLYDHLVSPGEQNWDVSQRQFPLSFNNYDCSLAKALGLTYLVLGSPLERLPGLSILPTSELLLSGPPVWIYRIPGAMPRVRMLGEFETEAARLDRPPRGEASPNQALVKAQAAWRVSTAPPLAAESSQGIAKIVSAAPGRVEVATTSASRGLLVLHDLYYPGWVGEIDGKATLVLRAELLFRAVEVPAGTHHITFRFVPFSLGNLRAALNEVLGRPGGGL
jgi:hypothetical protein